MKDDNPSNSDLYEKIAEFHASTKMQLDAIEAQVRRTNGRVTKLEKWKDKLDIIAEYTKEEKIDGKTVKVVDWEKIVYYALGLVGTALAIVLAMATKK